MLRRVMLKGFKSIKSMNLELRPLNVLIGANGSGKSNLISFFKMLNEMAAGRLQQYIGTSGRAQSLLHFGPKVTRDIEARLEFTRNTELEIDHGTNAYFMRLTYAAVNSLVFSDESLLREDLGTIGVVGLGSGHQESHLAELATQGNETANVVRALFNQCRVYHFHDTSPTARIRQHDYIGDSRSLLSDGGNLAAVLLRLNEQSNRTAYARILSTIRLIAPFFDDFELVELGTGTGTSTEAILNWRENGADQVFGPHQLSDGTLRAMCLIALLLQPENELPDFMIVDEPELGLHPYALNVIASLIKKAAHHTQVLVSTQSGSFLDYFDPEDVIVVNREGKESQFARPDPESLETWLDEYSLGEVWEKNVIGGGPH